MSPMQELKNAYEGKLGARSISQFEFSRTLDRTGWLFAGHTNTYLSKLWALGQGLKWEPKVVAPDLVENIRSLYVSFDSLSKVTNTGSQGGIRSWNAELADIFNRSSIAASGSGIVRKYLKNKMYDLATLESLVNSKSIDWMDNDVVNMLNRDGLLRFDRDAGGKKTDLSKTELESLDMRSRERIASLMEREAEAYLLDNVWTMAEAFLVQSYSHRSKSGINSNYRSQFGRIARMAQVLKDRARDDMTARHADKSLSSTVQMLELDQAYRKYRDSLKRPEEKELFDIMLLGPIEYGRRQDKGKELIPKSEAIKRFSWGKTPAEAESALNNYTGVSPVMLSLKSMPKDAINNYSRVVTLLLHSQRLGKTVHEQLMSIIELTKEVKKAEKTIKAIEYIELKREVAREKQAKKVARILSSAKKEEIFKIIRYSEAIEQQTQREVVKKPEKKVSSRFFSKPKTTVTVTEEVGLKTIPTPAVEMPIKAPFDTSGEPKKTGEYILSPQVEKIEIKEAVKSVEEAEDSAAVLDRFVKRLSKKGVTSLLDDTIKKDHVDAVERLIPKDFGSGVTEGKPTEFQQKYKAEATTLKKNLISAGATTFEDMNGVVRYVLGEGTGGAFGKDINNMSLADVQAINNFFTYLRAPNKVVQLFSKGDSIIKKAYYYMFPDDIGGDMAKLHIQLKEVPGFWANKHGHLMSGLVLKPTSAIETIADHFHNAETASRFYMDTLLEEYETQLAPYRAFDEYEDWYKIAVTLREYETLREKFRSGQTKLTEDIDTDLALKLDDEFSGAQARFNYYKTKQFKIKIIGEDGNDFINTVSGDAIINRINDVLTDRIKEARKLIDGEEGAILKVVKLDKDGSIRYIKDGQGKSTGVPAIDAEKLYKVLELSRAKGNAWTTEFGIDGIRRISATLDIQTRFGLDYRYIAVDKNLSDPAKKAKLAQAVAALNYLKEIKTGSYPLESYFPHKWTDNTELYTSINRHFRTIDSSTKLSPEQKVELKHLLVSQFLRKGSLEDLAKDIGLEAYMRNEEIITEAAEKKGLKQDPTEKLNYLLGNMRSGNQLERDMFAGGYDKSDWAFREYIKSLSDSYFRDVSERLSRIDISNMRKAIAESGEPDAQRVANTWATFLHLYADGASGRGVNIPKYLQEIKDLNLSGTLYKAYADNVVVDWVNGAMQKLGLSGDDIEKDSTLLDKKFGIFGAKKLHAFSRAEGAFEMMTLLLRPKAAVSNLFGGTLNTAISTGPSWIMKAQNVETFTKMHRDWVTIDDVKKDFVKWGFVENYILSDLEISTAMKKKSYKKFVDEAVGVLKDDPNVSDSSMLELARKHGITDAIMQKSSWFMRTSERKLRLDSAMAHYLKAVDALSPLTSFDEMASALPYDSPILLEMARKGVRATQFLYSSPYRPMFSNSALGKVMTRFQMYALNSLKFRVQVAKEAEMYGYQEGTEQFSKFKRMAVADMMSFALANAFAFSLFDSNLPQPYDWIQNLANWLFGGKDKERAFFGAYPSAIAPIQMFSPPALRLVGPTLNAILDQDVRKLATYNAVTMIPGGMMGMDIVKAMKNPEMGVEKITGIPQQGIINRLKHRRHPITGEWIKQKDEE